MSAIPEKQKWWNLAVFLAIAVLCILLALQAGGAEFQLMDARTLARARSYLPEIEDADIRKLFEDPTTIWYTAKEIEPAFQFADSGTYRGGVLGTNPVTRFFSARTRFPAPDRFGFGHAGLEPPWDKPGGIVDNTTIGIKLLWLPKKPGSDEPWPIVYWRKDVAGRPNTFSANGTPIRWTTNTILRWIFPRSTMLAEILALKDPRPGGKHHTFEIRIRIRGDDYWDPMIWKPYPRRRDLQAKLEEIDPPAAKRLKAENVVYTKTVSSGHPDRDAFRVQSWEHYLPDMAHETVIRLLNEQPFRVATDTFWDSVRDSDDPKDACFAPTTLSTFSIIPQGYQGTFLGSSINSCVRCHRDASAHVTRFQGARFETRREWYGFVPGSDRIMSFHPIAPSSIGRNGARRDVFIRKSFADAGIVEQFDLNKHPKDRYRKLAGGGRIQ